MIRLRCDERETNQNNTRYREKCIAYINNTEDTICLRCDEREKKIKIKRDIEKNVLHT